MKKACIVVTSILAVIIIAFAIFEMNSFSFAIRRAGFNPYDVSILETSFDDNGNEFRVIKTSSDKQEIVLAYMVKNRMGLWSVAYYSSPSSREETSSDTQFVSIGWMRTAGFKWYDTAEDPIFETEWHQLYYGNNAIKLIEFLPGQIPDNVAVNIRQAGNEYSIHLIFFGDSDGLNIDMRSLLLEAKCIKE